jgi:class 3 adenylate cyclase
MGLSVQVRVVDGTVERRWQRSVYLSPDPREITVSFADMRAAGTGARESSSPARIHSLLFVVDTVNARPGDRGVAWVERLRTER